MTWAERWGRRFVAATVGALALLMAGGIAYAAWTAAGTGATTAKAGTVQALTATASVTGGPLYPGASANLSVTVTNPNASAITVTTITKGTVTATAGCTTPGLTVTIPGTVSLAVPANSSATLSLTGAVTMSTSSSSDCQGATFTIPVTAAGQL